MASVLWASVAKYLTCVLLSFIGNLLFLLFQDLGSSFSIPGGNPCLALGVGPLQGSGTLVEVVCSLARASADVALEQFLDAPSIFFGRCQEDDHLEGKATPTLRNTIDSWLKDCKRNPFN